MLNYYFYEKDVVSHVEFNQIEYSINYLKSQLISMGAKMPPYQVTEWKYTSYLLASLLNKIEDAIKEMADAVGSEINYKKWNTNGKESFSYKDINRMIQNYNNAYQESLLGTYVTKTFTTSDQLEKVKSKVLTDITIVGNTTQNGTPTPTTPVPINVVTGRQEIQASNGGNTIINEIDLGDIELCKIDTYQDSIKKATGKNLFDASAITDGSWLKTDGSTETSSNYCVSDYIPIKGNTNYSLPKIGTKRLKYYNVNKEVLTNDWDITNGDSNQIITTPNNASYVRFSIYKVSIDINTFQFEEGSATSYEPYGTGWYIEKQIGKVVLDGSESWAYNSGNAVFTLANAVNYLTSGFIPYCDYYKGQNISGYAQLNDNSIGFLRNSTNNRMIIKNTDYTTANNFKTWLSTHNTIVYYVLANPTYTFIEDEELINQLSNIELLKGNMNIIYSTPNEQPTSITIGYFKES